MRPGTIQRSQARASIRASAASTKCIMHGESGEIPASRRLPAHRPASSPGLHLGIRRSPATNVAGDRRFPTQSEQRTEVIVTHEQLPEERASPRTRAAGPVASNISTEACQARRRSDDDLHALPALGAGTLLSRARSATCRCAGRWKNSVRPYEVRLVYPTGAPIARLSGRHNPSARFRCSRSTDSRCSSGAIVQHLRREPSGLLPADPRGAPRRACGCSPP